jgi:hypothetical protein
MPLNVRDTRGDIEERSRNSHLSMPLRARLILGDIREALGIVKLQI